MLCFEDRLSALSSRVPKAVEMAGHGRRVMLVHAGKACEGGWREMLTFGCSAFSCVSEHFSLPNRQRHLASAKGSKSNQPVEVLLSC